MSDYIEEIHVVERSGYVRGKQEVVVFFDKETGKSVDFESVGEFIIHRET